MSSLRDCNGSRFTRLLPTHNRVAEVARLSIRISRFGVSHGCVWETVANAKTAESRVPINCVTLGNGSRQTFAR